MSIKRISDDTFISWHEKRVSNIINKLEHDGYEVYEVRKIERCFLDIFGDNITEIHYKKCEENH